MLDGLHQVNDVISVSRDVMTTNNYMGEVMLNIAFELMTSLCFPNAIAIHTCATIQNVNKKERTSVKQI